jgi:hypothetical protein
MEIKVDAVEESIFSAVELQVIYAKTFVFGIHLGMLVNYQKRDFFLFFDCIAPN